MKVLFVIDTLYNAGAEKSLLEITRNFKKVVPVFVHIYKENALREEFRTYGIKVYSLDIIGQWNLKVAEKKLKDIYELELPDIVHATLFRSQIITRRLKKSYPTIPLINSIVSDSYSVNKLKNENRYRKIKGNIIKFWDRYTAKKVDFFVSNSETTKKSMSKSLNVSEEIVKVIYRGRDINSILKYDQNIIPQLIEDFQLSNKKVLINVGRLIESKGQMDIIDVMPKLIRNHPEIVLLIAGEGNFRKRLEQRIDELNLGNYIHLLGNRKDIPELLALSDIFVFPTYLEGLPGSLIEAMLSEKIICCSNIPVNLECVNEDSAIIFNVGNQIDLYEKVDYSLKNIQVINPKAKIARKEAVLKFDINIISQQYEDFYNQVVQNH